MRAAASPGDATTRRTLGTRANSVGAPPTIRAVTAEGGTPLAPGLRAFFEPRFGFDLSQVKVHAGVSAARSAQALDARAYAYGRDIVLGAAHPASDTSAGRHLLAHELAHVVQDVPGVVHRSPTETATPATAEEPPEVAEEPPVEIPEDITQAQLDFAEAQAAAIAELMDREWLNVLDSEAEAGVLVHRVDRILRQTFELRHGSGPQLAPHQAPLLQYLVAQYPALRERLALLRLRSDDFGTDRLVQYLNVPRADPGRYTYEIFMAGVGGGEVVEGNLAYVTIRYLEKGTPMWTRRFVFVAAGAGVGVLPVSFSADVGWNAFTAPEYWYPSDFGGGEMVVVGAGYATIGPPPFLGGKDNGQEIEGATIYGDHVHIPIEADIGGKIWGTTELGASAVYGWLVPLWLGPGPAPGKGVLPPPPDFGQARPVQAWLRISFDTGVSDIDAGGQAHLAEFVDEYRDVLSRDDFLLTLVGHASRTGSSGLNQRLSEARRTAVLAQIESLLGTSIDDAHLEGGGMGERAAQEAGMEESDDSAHYRSVQVMLAGTRVKPLE
jgi:hypothetical protein